MPPSPPQPSETPDEPEGGAAPGPDTAGERSPVGGGTQVDDGARPPDAPPGLTEGAPLEWIAGRYEIRGLIGRGGMGEVLLAWDHFLEREVALKKLLGEHASDARIMERFEREAKALARLDNEHVIAVFDVLAPPEGARYIVLEYVRGRSLAEDIVLTGSLPWEECVRIGTQVCSALSAAHGAGIVHRDIKPENILLKEPDRAVRVADFGISRLNDGSVSRSGMLIGTPAYMAPEQARGGRVTASTDVYALGAVLFEAVSGRQPYEVDEPSPFALAALHVSAPVPDPAEAVPDLPEPVRELLMRCMQKDPSDRFASADDLARALAATLPPRDAPSPPPDERPPAVDRPPPPVHRGPRRPSRRAALLIAAVGLPGIVLGVLAAGVLAGDPAETVIALTPDGNGSLTIRHPTDWTFTNPDQPALRGLNLREQVTLRAPGAPGAGLAAGFSTGTGRQLLPETFAARLEAPPRGTAPQVRLAGRPMLRHAGLAPKDEPGLRTTVFATPTTAGTLTVVCYGPADGFEAYEADCSRVAQGTSLRGGITARPLAPDRVYASRLDAALRPFREPYGRALATLSSARATRAAQVDAASGAAGAAATLAAGLGRIDASAQSAPAQEAFAAAASRTAAAYRGLAAAGSQGRASEWARRAGIAEESSRRLRAASDGLTALGYPPRVP